MTTNVQPALSGQRGAGPLEVPGDGAPDTSGGPRGSAAGPGHFSRVGAFRHPPEDGMRGRHRARGPGEALRHLERIVEGVERLRRALTPPGRSSPRRVTKPRRRRGR